MTPPAPDLASRAAEALDAATADPRRARVLAGRVREEARRAGDAGARSMADQALGVAARELGEVAVAVSHLRAAVAGAERAGLGVRAAEARVSLAPTLQYAGRPLDALREADRAAGVLRGPARARLQMQRSGILVRLERFDEALALLGPAAAAFRRTGDAVWEARAHNARGIAHGHRGAHEAGDRAFRRAADLFARAGDEVAVAQMLCNRAWLAGRQGAVPTALVLHDDAEARLAALGVPLGPALVDRCEVFLAVHLAAEARATAERAAEELAAGGMASDVPEAWLKVAQAALLEGDAAGAAVVAGKAAKAFARQARPAWEAAARWIVVQARYEDGARTAAVQRAALAAADALTALGQSTTALDARLVAARIAVERRRVGEAEAVLGGIRVGARAPAALRARAWEARALVRAARGDGAGSERALRAGWRVLDDYRAGLGATELRASVSGHGEGLARLGVASALAAGRPDAVLRWAERGRAAALRLRPVRPPADGALARGLAELREVAADLVRAESRAEADRLTARLVALEESVRRHARQAAGTGDREAIPALGRLAGALGDAVLVEIVPLDGGLHALVVRDGRAELRFLGSAADADREVEHLRFALRRLATRRGSQASLAAAAAGAGAALERLELLLLAPVADLVGDRALVVSPPGRLHALPWSALPSCRGRPVSVVPSAALWLAGHEARARADRGRLRRDHALLVAGPDLPHARAEVDRLHRAYPRAMVLAGPAATAAAVGDAMARADLAHVAAHGSFRADNPLFSCLRLADGPFTVYDLEAVRPAPTLLVLSACDSGLSAVRPGDELMGLAAALLMIGTRALVASVGPVPDDTTAPLMVDFHQRLGAGATPAAALAAAGGSRRASTDPAWAAAASFVCFGAG